MADYRFLYASIKDPSAILGELPMSNAGFSDVLNGPGSFSGTLPLNPYPATPTLITPETVAPGRTVVYVERDEVILWGGIIWGASASVGSNSLQLSGEGWLSYFRRRYIRSTLDFGGFDQDGIARGLIDYAQGVTGGDIGVTTVSNVHGVARDRYYAWFERKNIGYALEELAAVERGFDFKFQSTYASGVIATNFVTTYPKLGRLTDHVFEIGTNVEIVDYTVDGTTIVNQVDVLGSGQGSELILRSGFNSASIASYPLLEDVESFPDVVRLSTLAARAGRAITQGSKPVGMLSLSVYPDAVPKLGSYEIGDRVKVRGSYGWLEVDGFFRITQLLVSIAPGSGMEMIALTLAQQELFE